MGRSILFIVVGLIISLGYTFSSMRDRRKALTQHSVTTYNQAKAKNLSKTGIQFAINKFQQDNTWRGPETLKLEGGSVDISITETDSLIDVTSISQVGSNNEKHKIVTTFDKSEREQLVPDFRTSLGITTTNFTFGLGGSANVDGTDDTGKCGSDKPGVAVINETAQTKVGTNSRIDGDPEDIAAIDNDLNYNDYSELVNRLEDNPKTKYLSGDYSKSMGSKDNPGIFFIESDITLTNGQSNGYGVIVIREDGEINYSGSKSARENFTFNGLVIYSNAYELDEKGTPTYKGSVVIGTGGETETSIDIRGDVALQYNCTKERYARTAVHNAVPRDRVFQKLSTFR